MFAIKTRDHLISIDSDHPDKAGSLLIQGDTPQEIKDWISSMSGFRGIGLSGTFDAPLDLVSGLSTEKAVFEILEGKEILDIPTQDLPDGAVW